MKPHPSFARPRLNVQALNKRSVNVTKGGMLRHVYNFEGHSHMCPTHVNFRGNVYPRPPPRICGPFGLVV